MLLLSTMAWAGPQLVIAAGDRPESASPEGWVTALGDCLTEKQPGTFHVVDRRSKSETLESLSARVDELLATNPSWLVVAFAGFPAQPGAGALEQQAQQMCTRARRGPSKPQILWLTLPASSEPEAQANVTLAKVANQTEGVMLLDLSTRWPSEPLTKGGRTLSGWSPSPQSDAAIAASVCDAVLNDVSGPSKKRSP